MTHPLPQNWQQVKLGDIGSFSKGSGISKSDLSESGNFAVRYGELYTKHHFRIKKIYSFIPDEILPTTKLIKSGDILFAGSGETIDEIGKSAVYQFDDPCYASGDTIIFTPKHQNSLFLAYALNIGSSRKELRRLGQGQSVVHIYKRGLEELHIVIPPLPEQHHIVTILETWDKAIEVLQRKIELKKNVKKGLMQQLLTGMKRLPGLSKEWEEVKLGDCLKVKHGKSQKEVEDVNGDFPILGTGGEMGRTKDFLYDKPSVLIGRKGTIDKPKYMDTPFWTVDTLFYTEIFNSCHPKFFYFVFLLIPWKLYNEGSGIPSLSASTISTIKIQIPDLNEQEAVANLLTSADKEIELLQSKLQKLKAQKVYLLNHLITGRIRTPETMSIS